MIGPVTALNTTGVRPQAKTASCSFILSAPYVELVSHILSFFIACDFESRSMAKYDISQ
jgi:hypothetical protein